MKKLLVLTDFSFSSFNASRYAVQLANSLDNCEVIFYHSFYLENIPEPSFIAVELDLASFKKQSKERLKDLHLSLKPFIKANTKLEFRADEQNLIIAAEKICLKENINLVIIGNKNHSTIETLFFGSKVREFINFFSFPFMVIPPMAFYEPYVDVMLACELKDVENIPVDYIHRLMKKFEFKFHILNIDTEKYEKTDTKKMLQQEKLHKIMDFMNPQYHYTSHPVLAEGLEDLAHDIRADLILIVHKKLGFFESLIHASTTKRLAALTTVPLMILNEEQGEK